MAPGVAQAGAEAADPLGLLRTYGPQLGLAFLALASMGLMMRTVRKAAAMPATKFHLPEAESTDEPMLAAGMNTIGQAAAGETMLTGREVDDETLRYQELGNEVSKLVEADPEGAAQLIRRWMED
jgi:flagellar biosynthesis/type III secretory pathway M-ring protein FliF/YscJ